MEGQTMEESYESTEDNLKFLFLRFLLLGLSNPRSIRSYLRKAVAVPLVDYFAIDFLYEILSPVHETTHEAIFEGYMKEILASTPYTQKAVEKLRSMPGKLPDVYHAYLSIVYSYENVSYDIDLLQALYPDSDYEKSRTIVQYLEGNQLAPAQINKLLEYKLPLCSGGNILRAIILTITDQSTRSFPYVGEYLTSEAIFQALIRDGTCSPDSLELNLDAEIAEEEEALSLERDDNQRHIIAQDLQTIKGIQDAIAKYRTYFMSRNVTEELSIHPPSGTFPGGSEVRQAAQHFEGMAGTISTNKVSVRDQAIYILQHPSEVGWDDITRVAGQVGILPFSDKQQALVQIAIFVKAILSSLDAMSLNDLTSIAKTFNVNIVNTELIKSAILSWVKNIDTSVPWHTLIQITNNLGITSVPDNIPDFITYLYSYSTQL